MGRPSLLSFWVCLGLLLAGFGSADTLYEWKFEDTAGTFLSSTESSGENADAMWDGDFDRSSTNGSGLFMIGRTPGGIANAYAEISSRDLTEDEIWVILELNGWQFQGKSAKETLRLGIADTAH
ncbi:MAG: hypothetical protein ACQKBT_08435, partial [Puniceicoccales bacterium]